MNAILNQYLNNKQFKTVMESPKPVYIHDMADESQAHFLYSYYKAKNSSIIYVADNLTRAKVLVDEINSIEEVSHLFMREDISYHDIKNLNPQVRNSRIEIIYKLCCDEKIIVITTIDAILTKISNRETFLDNTIKIDLDSKVNLSKLRKKLIDLEYEHVANVEQKGQFSIRGSIVDIWSINSNMPVRMELFDDEVDSIRTFDYNSRRSLDKITEFSVIAQTDIILNDDIRSKLVKEISKNLDKYLRENQTNDTEEYDNVFSKYNRIREQLETNEKTQNKLLFTSFLPDHSLVDLSDDITIVFSDLSRIYDSYKNQLKQIEEDIDYLVKKRELFETQKNMFISFENFLNKSKSHPIINITKILRYSSLIKPHNLVSFKTMEVENFNRDINLFAKHILELYENKTNIIIFAQREDEIKDIDDYFKLNNYYPAIFNNLDFDIEEKKIAIVKGSLSKGYRLLENNLYCYSSSDLYGNYRLKISGKNKKKSSDEIINYSELEIGDYVVHELNGIGQYKGIKNINVMNVSKDYLVIEYRLNDKIYIPVDQISMIHKYIGNGTNKPKLSRLGSLEWSKAKARAKKNVNEIAADLVQLYAKRQKVKGFVYSPDSIWQREFEQSFEYEETFSQLRSVEEIKEDMQSEKVMDRLLCGDVGFGKTEVALRAAFKAVDNSKQVAFLVPTTILARQHYETMKERFKQYPISVEMISRFSTKKSKEETIKKLKKGMVDIVVGTHALLSDKIDFKNLGLLLIDEEQRFGVKHKEKLKNLKENVDVLTLSATPIPRTLQMSLTGIRDMSTLDEAPKQRIPINSYVLEYNDLIIKEAIEKEIKRGGQVYFVYNRIDDMHIIYNSLTKLLPNARIQMAHGRMKTTELERIMVEFIDKKIDVLISTTIIETGMDIQNVNTIIVYDSDMFGLGQLYQLKGRIGRSDRTSYAYFTYRPGKLITEVGEKRLKAIKDFSEFGSGYKVAMRDLELRGAGNILGESQSGHVDDIGYDLYVKYLKEALNNLKQPDKNNTNDYDSSANIYIDIRTDAYIPEKYISNTDEKIEIYNKIAVIETKSDYYEMVEYLIDVYGDIPVSVDNIMYVSLIKSLAAKNGFKQIVELDNLIILEYYDRDKYSFEQLKSITEEFKGDIRIDLSNKPSFKFESSRNKLVDCFNLLTIIDNLRRKDE